MIGLRTTFAAVMTACLWSVAASPVAADRFEHSFGRSTAGQAAFVIGFDADAKRVDVEESGLRFRNDRRIGPMESMGVKSVFAICGDGQVKLRFKAKHLGIPESGWGSGVMLRLEFVGPDERGLTVARQAEVDGKQTVMIDFTTHGQDEHEVTKFEIGSELLPNEISAIEVSRRGDQLSVSVSSQGKNVVLTQKPAPPGDIHPVGVWVGTGGASCDLDVTLIELVVEGASLPSDTLVPPAPRSWWATARWGFAAMFVVMMLLFAFMKARR